MNNMYDFVLEDNYVLWEIDYSMLLHNIFPEISEYIHRLSGRYEKRTVFGMKLDNNWNYTNEFYYYNNNTKIQKVHYHDICDIWEIPQIIQNHFMFSFEYSDWWSIDFLDFYNTDWYSYRFDWKIIEPRNRYDFFWKDELDNWYTLLLSYNKNNIAILQYAKLFDRFLIKKGKVCISKKKLWYWIYLNRINYQGFILFLKLFKYDNKIITFFINNKYQRLNFDIWLDFKESNWKMEIVKTGFYGVF